MRRIPLFLLALQSLTIAAAATRVQRDVAYGPDARQRFDVYAPIPARRRGPSPPSAVDAFLETLLR
jgi:hypothetical protein